MTAFWTPPPNDLRAVGSHLSADGLVEGLSRGLVCIPLATAAERAIANFRYRRLLEANELQGYDWDGCSSLAYSWWFPSERVGIDTARWTLNSVDRRYRRDIRKVSERVSWHTTVNRKFEYVLDVAQTYFRQPWVTPEYAAVAKELHENGQAFSVEAWKAKEFAGAVFGFQVGSYVTLESGFTLMDGGMKVAAVDLISRALRSSFLAVDLQWDSVVARRLGATEFRREWFAASQDPLPQLDTAIREDINSLINDPS